MGLCIPLERQIQWGGNRTVKLLARGDSLVWRSKFQIVRYCEIKNSDDRRNNYITPAYILSEDYLNQIAMCRYTTSSRR